MAAPAHLSRAHSMLLTHTHTPVPAQDHLNDVMSNVAAIAGASAAGYLPRYWWVDGGMAILFSLLIIRNWVMICWEQVRPHGRGRLGCKCVGGHEAVSPVCCCVPSAAGMWVLGGTV